MNVIRFLHGKQLVDRVHVIMLEINLMGIHILVVLKITVRSVVLPANYASNKKEKSPTVSENGWGCNRVYTYGTSVRFCETSWIDVG